LLIEYVIVIVLHFDGSGEQICQVCLHDFFRNNEIFVKKNITL
jgi:hypothetical protein